MPTPWLAGFSRANTRPGQVRRHERPGIVLGAIFRCDMGLVMCLIDRVPRVVLALGVEQNHVVDVAPSTRTTMGACSLPNDLVLELRRTEYAIQDQLQVMAGGRVAV